MLLSSTNRDEIVNRKFGSGIAHLLSGRANPMPTLKIVIPGSIDSALRETATKRGTSVDSLAGAVLGEYLKSDRRRLYQISTSDALVEGVHTGAVSSRYLMEQGDFGLGTFEDLNGEMVIADGEIYQVHSDGTVIHRLDDFQIPFAVIARFQGEASFETGPIGSMEDLERACDPHPALRPSPAPDSPSTG
jgi:acetolactate decarboxylase